MCLIKKCKTILFCLFIVAMLTSCNHKPLYIIMFGAPGSGKGTMAGLLSKKYNIPQLSVGEMLRKSLDAGNKAGKDADIFMKKGRLVPDELINKIMIERFKEPDCRHGLILDGYPRTLGQAKELDQIIEKLPKGRIVIINLEIKDDEVINRIKKRAVCAKCNSGKIDRVKFASFCDECHGDEVIRADDNAIVAKQRLNVYRTSTKPVIDYYRQHKGFISIDSSQSVDQIFSSLLEAVSKNTDLK